MSFYKIIPIIFLIAHSIITLGQDVGLVQMIYPVANQQVHLQYTYDIEIVVRNSGTAVVPKDAGMTFILLYDGLNQGNFSLNTHPKINAGDSLTVTINNQSFSTPNATLEIAVVVVYAGDLNKNNDTIKNVLGFSVDNNVDLGPSFIDVIAPNIDSVFNPGENIVVMRATINNYGTVTLPREYIVKIESTIYGQTKGPFTGITSTALDPSGNLLITISGQQPKVQSNNGPFQICVTIVSNSDDKNNSNDEYCQIFYAYDWTDVQEFDGNDISSYNYLGNLHLNNLKNGVQIIQIYDTKGQIVHHEKISSVSSEGIINISQIQNGFYILKVFQNDKVIHSNKFVIN